MKRRVDGGKHVGKRVSARHRARPPVFGYRDFGFRYPTHLPDGCIATTASLYLFGCASHLDLYGARIRLGAAKTQPRIVSILRLFLLELIDCYAFT
jgi:hypothetical protein